MSKLTYDQSLSDNITFRDIANFLTESWKLILSLVFSGLLYALFFLWSTPSQYEAVAQIKIAQMYSSKNPDRLGLNLEDVSELLARMKVPSYYSDGEIKVCNLADSKSPGEAMIDLVDVSVIKGVSSIIQLKIRSESKEQSVACAQSIYEHVRESQDLIRKPLVDYARNQLLNNKVRQQEINTLIAEGGKAMSFDHLVIFDELRFLNEENKHFNDIVFSGDAFGAKLVSPIYVSDIPVYPNKKLILVKGLWGGDLLGCC